MNVSTRVKPIEVLLVEDSRSDVLLTREALKEQDQPIRLSVVEDGVEALAYLNRSGSYAQAAMPQIILLDLNLPRKDGREVLRDLKDDTRFRHIPVIVLTTSKAESDIRMAYELHANCYVTKPVDFDQFRQKIAALSAFWFEVAVLMTEG